MAQIWSVGIGDLAFFMRDKCDKRDWTNALLSIDMEDSPQKWIKAAVKAWEAKDEEDVRIQTE